MPGLLRVRSMAVAVALAVLAVTACTDGSEDEALGDTTTSSTVDVVAAEEASEPEPVWSLDEVLAADPACADPVQGEPLRIGYAADFSEIGAVADVPGTEAARHLARLINCSGGVDGTPMEINVADVSGSPLASRAAVRGLLDWGAQAIIGPPFPDPGFRVLQVTDGRIPVVFAASTEPALADPTSLSFLVAFDDTRGATAAARFALDRGWSTAVTMSSPGPYFGYNPLVFAAVFEAGGGTVLADYPYTPGATEQFGPALAEMVSQERPDVIYSAMLANQIAALRSQAATAGLEAEFIGSDAFEASGGYATEGVDGIFHTTHGFADADSRVVALDESFAAATGSASASPAFAALAADAMVVIIDAYVRTGGGDPVAIGEAIAAGTGVQAVTGVLRYNGAGSPAKPVYIHEVVAGAPTLAEVIDP